MTEHIGDEIAYRKYSEQYMMSQLFFDIFENKYKNDAVKSLVRDKTTSEIDKADLAFMLPYTNSFLPEVRREINRSRAASHNVNAAVSYATARVSIPNIIEYGYSSSDCTNFVSQVIKAGGVAEVCEADTIINRGWWHKKNASGANVYSNSWIYANSFVNFFGPSFTTSSFYNFSLHVNRGDVIALDHDTDSDWDHCGYVTQTQDTINSLGYYDMFIAQHSTDYHYWASHYACGWDDQPASSRYCVIHWQSL